MKKIIFILIIMLTVNLSVIAQLTSFIKVYGNSGYDHGRDIKEDNDSGFVVTGSSSSFGSANAEVVLLKVDKYGDFVWSYNYGGVGSDWGESIVVTNDSSYAIAGYTNSFGSGGFDFFLVRASQTGSPLWTKTYGGSDWDKAYDIIQMPDSGFVLVGETFSFSGSKDGYIIRTDKNGDTLWTKVIGSAGDDFLKAVYYDGDSLIVCGGNSSLGTLDGYICKMDISGNVGWEKHLGSAYDDFFTSIDGFNSYYILGGTRGYNFPTDDDDLWIYKISNDGFTEIFDTTFPNSSPEKDGVNDVAVNIHTEDLFFTGHTSSWGYQLDGLSDLFMGKLNSSGDMITANNYGEKGEDVGHALDYCRDYGVVLVGDTKFFSTGGNNIIIIKVSYLWDYPNQFIDLTYNDVTTSLIEIEPSKEIGFSPNPVKDIIHFEVDAEIEHLSIYSADGKLMMELKPTNNEVNLSELQSGFYLLSLQFESQIKTIKIIKD